jgi:hypothetical protein
MVTHAVPLRNGNSGRDGKELFFTAPDPVTLVVNWPALVRQ